MTRAPHENKLLAAPLETDRRWSEFRSGLFLAPKLAHLFAGSPEVIDSKKDRY